jgi:hypothetical protein
MELRRTPRETMVANHAARRLTRAVVNRSTVVANVPVLLELGGTIYIQFQGKPFGVPPVAWRVGQTLLAARFDAMAAAAEGKLTPDTTPRYYAAMKTLARVLWRHSRPVGGNGFQSWLLRVAKALKLYRNPYRLATEAELVALTDFFLQRRMASGGGLRAIPHPQPSMTP